MQQLWKLCRIIAETNTEHMAQFIDLEDNRFFAQYSTFEGCTNNLHDALGFARPDAGANNRALIDLNSTGRAFVTVTSWGALYIGKTGSNFYPFFRETV